MQAQPSDQSFGPLAPKGGKRAWLQQAGLHPLALLILFLGSVVYGPSLTAQGGGLSVGGVSSSDQNTPIPCCDILRYATDPNDKRPVQVGDYGGFNYLLSNVTTTGGESYGVLTKNYPNGTAVWRYQLTEATRVTGFTFTDEGEILVSGYYETGNTRESRLLRLRVGGTPELAYWYRWNAIDQFAAIVRDPFTSRADKYLLAGTEKKEESRVFAPTLYRTADPSSAFTSGRQYTNTQSAGPGATWAQVIPLPDDQSIAIRSTGGLQNRGTIFKFDANGDFLDGRTSETGIRYTEAIRLPDGLVVIAGERRGAFEQTRGVPALWLANDNLAVFDEIRWPDGLSGGITSLTHAKLNDTTFIYVGAVTSQNEAAIIRLSIDSIPPGNTIVAEDPDPLQKSAAIPLGNDYFFIQRYANTLDTAASGVVNVQLNTSRDGRHLLYAHGRTSGANDNHQLYYGQLPLDLNEACISRLSVFPQSIPVVAADVQTLSGTVTAPPPPSTVEAGWFSSLISAPQRCRPDVIDGCRQAYPIPTYGYFRITPSPDCAGKQLTLRVLNARGREILTQPASGTAAALVDISASPRGTYLIQWIDENGKVLHTSSVLLT